VCAAGAAIWWLFGLYLQNSTCFLKILKIIKIKENNSYGPLLHYRYCYNGLQLRPHLTHVRLRGTYSRSPGKKLISAL
jgi:hypothetical protein